MEMLFYLGLMYKEIMNNLKKNYFKSADDFSVPEELNDDKSVLAYYGVADGGTVFIHDDGDRK